jgi:hypothetical protein
MRPPKRYVPQDLPEIPDKPRLYVREAAGIVAQYLNISETAAIHRIYRRIGDGSIQAMRYLGVLMIPREELIRVLSGDPI